MFLTLAQNASGKKDGMNEIKNYCQKVLCFCAHLSSFVKSTFAGASIFKSGVRKVLVDGARTSYQIMKLDVIEKKNLQTNAARISRQLQPSSLRRRHGKIRGYNGV